MSLHQLAAADLLHLESETKEALQAFSAVPVVFHTTPSTTPEQVIARIGAADGALVSFGTPLTSAVLAACPNLRYIGVCGTNLSDIDEAAVQARGITVTNVTDYADEATAEWVIGQLIALARGWGGVRWQQDTVELTGKTLGIVGMGAVATQLVKRALSMDMRVIYHNRSRKSAVEALGVEYRALPELLEASDIVSLHVPKNVQVLDRDLLTHLGAGKVLVNTCLGTVVPPQDLAKWLGQGERFAILDEAPDKAYLAALTHLPGAVLVKGVGGITRDSRLRLGEKVVENLENSL